MADEENAVTSEDLAQRMHTDPAVVRRTMAGLRDAGIVRSEKGHGGGWSLARGLDEITLGNVYEALEITTLFAVGHRTESPGCLVEQAVNRSMDEAFSLAEKILTTHLARVKLSAVAADVRKHASKHRPKGGPCA